jgi:HEAT repeat protein
MQEVEGDPAYLRAVLAGLKSREPRERRLSARRFGMLHLSDPFGTLKPLLDDPDSNLRLAAVDALEDITDQRAASMLLKMAATDSSQEVREASLQELSKYLSEEILEFLLSEANRPHRSRRPRQLIAEQLKNYNTEASVDALLRLTQDTDAYVQERAIESLFQLNRPRLREFWVLTERNWKGTYWGKLARDALRNLQGSKVAKEHPRSQIRPHPSKVMLVPKDIQERRFTSKARQAARVARQQTALIRMDEALYLMVNQLATALHSIIYKDVLEKVRDKLAAMVPYRDQAHEHQALRHISSKAGARPHTARAPAATRRARAARR